MLIICLIKVTIFALSFRNLNNHPLEKQVKVSYQFFVVIDFKAGTFQLRMKSVIIIVVSFFLLNINMRKSLIFQQKVSYSLHKFLH